MPQKWTMDEVALLIRHADERTEWRRLFPGRPPTSVRRKAHKLGLRSLRSTEGWTAEEDGLLRQIGRLTARLEQSGRSQNAIGKRASQLRAREEFATRALAEVRQATAHVPAAVRDDVQQEVIAEVLGCVVSLTDLPAAVRRATTRAYGPRHYSLDAPLGDEGGGTWVDTIESDRPHF